MSSKIVKEESSKLLHRIDVSLQVEYDNNVLSKADAQKIVAKEKKADESLVVIKKISPVYGHKKAVIVASIYDSADALKKVEPPKKEKKAVGEAAPAAPAKKK